jgi:hypothetical protein
MSEYENIISILLIIDISNNIIILFSYHNDPKNHTYTRLNVLCRQQGYTDEFVEKMINVIVKTTYDKKIRTTNDDIDF